MVNKLTSIALLAILATSAVPATAGKLVAPGNLPLRATNVQAGIINPITNTCPAKATMSIWIITNKPGPVSYMIAKKGGNVSGPFTLQSKKGNHGMSVATFTKKYEMHQPFNAEYRVLIPQKSGNLMSNWVHMKASCKIILGG